MIRSYLRLLIITDILYFCCSFVYFIGNLGVGCNGIFFVLALVKSECDFAVEMIKNARIVARFEAVI